MILAVPTSNLILSTVQGESYTFVLLTTLGAIVGILAAVALWESLRRPFRRRVLTGKDLIDTVDIWLREVGYGRRPTEAEGYSHALIASFGSSNVLVAVEPTRNQLLFAAARTQSETDTTLLGGMSAKDQYDLKYEFQLELARFGVFYSVTENPLSITVFVSLTVDESLNEGLVVDRVDFIRRADHLVELLAQRRAVALLLSEPSKPSLDNIAQGIQDASQSTRDTAENQPGSV